MKLIDFSGGLSTRLAAHAIQPQYSRLFVNVNYKTQELGPVKNKTIAAGTTGIQRYSYWFEAGNEWVSKAVPTSYAEWQETLYIADGITSPKKRRNGVERNLGIVPPALLPNWTVTNGPSKIVRVDLIPLQSFGDFPRNSSVSYIFVNFNSATGLNSGRSEQFHIELDAPTFNWQDAVRLQNVGAAFSTSTKVYRLNGGQWREVGTFTTSTGSVLDNIFDLAGRPVWVDDQAVNGTVQYAFTFYNSAEGIESAPLITNEIVVNNGRVSFTNLPVSADPQVTHVGIYRIGGNLTTFTLVARVPVGTTVYNDDAGDLELPGNLLQSSNDYPPPVLLNFITEYKAMLFGVVEDKLYFSEIGKPNAWPQEYFLDFSGKIFGLSVTQSGLLIHLRTSTYILRGDRPTQFTVDLHSGDQGCINHLTTITRGGSAIWVSADGVCTSNGVRAQTLTKDRLDQLVLSPVNAVLHDQVYYVQLTNGQIFFIDFAYQVFGYYQLGTTYLVVGNNILYGFENNALHRLFNSDNSFVAFAYASPDFISTGLTRVKAYKDFLIHSKGLLVLKVWVNEKEALETNINSSEFETHELKVHKNATKGNKLRFTLSGPGTVKEIFFSEDSANGTE